MVNCCAACGLHDGVMGGPVDLCRDSNTKPEYCWMDSSPFCLQQSHETELSVRRLEAAGDGHLVAVWGPHQPLGSQEPWPPRLAPPLREVPDAGRGRALRQPSTGATRGRRGRGGRRGSRLTEGGVAGSMPTRGEETPQLSTDVAEEGMYPCALHSQKSITMG